MANSLEVKCTPFPHTSELLGDELAEATQVMLGKSLFDTREYRRAAHSLEKCNSSKAVFLRLYSLYLVWNEQPVYQQSILNAQFVLPLLLLLFPAHAEFCKVLIMGII